MDNTHNLVWPGIAQYLGGQVCVANTDLIFICVERLNQPYLYHLKISCSLVLGNLIKNLKPMRWTKGH